MLGNARARLGAQQILARLTKVHRENLHLLNQGSAIFTPIIEEKMFFFSLLYLFFNHNYINLKTLI